MHDTISTQQTYNGWCNRETWMVNLWLTNDEGSYTILEQVCRMGGDTYDKTDCLERHIREYYDGQYPDASIWSDLTMAALGRVNWYEIVENN